MKSTKWKKSQLEISSIAFQAARIRNAVDAANIDRPEFTRVLLDVADTLEAMDTRTFPSESDRKLLSAILEFFQQYADNTDVSNGLDALEFTEALRRLLERMK